MKTAILLASLISTSLMAKTTVTIPLQVEINNKVITTAELNKKFKLKGEDKLIETLVVSNDSASLRAANETYWAQNAKADELSTKLGVNFYMELSDPNGCYAGVPAEAVEILGSLADGPFSDQLGFFGYKFKKEIHLLDGNDETLNYLNEESKTWKNWKGLDDSILITFHITDDGGDVNEALITKCK